MKWGHSTAMGNNPLCSQFRMAAGTACETRGGEARPGCKTRIKAVRRRWKDDGGLAERMATREKMEGG